jgi:hydroxypyruvate reductase
MSPRDLLIGSFRAAVSAVQADAILPAHLPVPTTGRTLVVGAGKAAASMATSLERSWPAEAELSGLVITRHRHGSLTHRIRVVEAGHPLPDAAGQAAAGEILRLLAQAAPTDQVIALISGGGSSLLSLPTAGLTLEDVSQVSRNLLASGAPIAEINIVRKHLSRTLGGRLAEACLAPVLALVVSDVAGDDPASIASGPFSPDNSTFTDAMDVLDRWQIVAPTAVRSFLHRGVSGLESETPGQKHPCFRQVENRIIANGHTALEAAAAWLRSQGIESVILGDTISGEAREVTRVFAALAREIRQHASPWTPPVAILSGGETSVTVRGSGRGGRNTEFQLSLALHLEGLEGVHALAADTDGIDGTEDNAGAYVGPNTLERARAQGLDPLRHLWGNDAYSFFAGIDDLLLTGPTLTNVNDYRAILVV